MRLGAQIAAIESIIRDGSQNTLNNYIERLDVKGSDIKDPNKANATLDNRLSEASEKYNKLDAYLKAKNLNINPAKKDKIVDTLFKEKDLSEKVFDKLKEEGCFLPNTPTYQELDKLQNVSVEKKIKLHDAFVKIAGE
ncbi:hypothetical protein IJU97_03275 [bacterium]|nr:hypothetical protein [bacterium]